MLVAFFKARRRELSIFCPKSVQRERENSKAFDTASGYESLGTSSLGRCYNGGEDLRVEPASEARGLAQETRASYFSPARLLSFAARAATPMLSCLHAKAFFASRDYFFCFLSDYRKNRIHKKE